jgi:F0F1-type ATP synthase assembly protein I
VTDPKPANPQPGGPWKLAGLGLELAAAVTGSCLLGYWIDRKFDCSPWGLLICAAVGIVGGMYNMIRRTVHQMVDRPEDRREDQPDDGTDG